MSTDNSIAVVIAGHNRTAGWVLTTICTQQRPCHVRVLSPGEKGHGHEQKGGSGGGIVDEITFAVQLRVGLNCHYNTNDD